MWMTNLSCQPLKSKLGIKVSIPNSLGAVESLWWQPDTGKRVLNIQCNNGTQCLVLSGESEMVRRVIE